MYIPSFTITTEAINLIAEQCLLKSIREMLESNQKSNQKIIAVMHRNPSVTIKELQEYTELSESGVKKIIRQLRTEGIITRVGGAKGGHWEINK